MKSLQAPNLKTIAQTKVMYTAIRSYYEQAFDNMSEKSEKKTNILSALSSINRCGLFQFEALLSRPKNMAASDLSRLLRKRLKIPSRVRWPRMCLIKDIIKFGR